MLEGGDPDKIRERLVAEGLQTDSQAVAGVRAKFCCEYCGLDFLASVENFRQRQWDHIKPQGDNGPDVPDNLVCSSKFCNCLKCSWNPSRVVKGSNPSREELVEAGRNYIVNKKKKEQEPQLQRWRKATGWRVRDRLMLMNGAASGGNPRS